jgi:hypothetical protein
VEAPTSSLAYLDSAAIFGRVYGLFRGVASMGLIPHLASYVDLNKLPSPETITRHLSPMIASSSVEDGGLLAESVGPITTTQATLVTAIAVGAIAFPMVEEELKGQSVTIPGFPGLNLNPSQSGQNQPASPLLPGGYTSPFPPAISPATTSPAPSASPSAGTP